MSLFPDSFRALPKPATPKLDQETLLKLEAKRIADEYEKNKNRKVHYGNPIMQYNFPKELCEASRRRLFSEMLNRFPELEFYSKKYQTGGLVAQFDQFGIPITEDIAYIFNKQ